MTGNEIPKSYEPLIELMEDAADGLHTHEVALAVLQNTEAKTRIDLTRLIGTPAAPGVPAVPGLKSLWNAAKADKTAKTALARSAMSNGRALLMTCIGSLKPIFGQQWNSQWNAVGFTDSSLRVPTNPMVKLQQMSAFYAANPAREVASVNGIACTAANCDATAQALSTADSASNQSNVDAGTAKSNLETGISAARNRMIGLRTELEQLLADDDPRWLAFGFDMPGQATAPDVPANFVVTPGAAGSRQLFLDCDNARRADSYRFVIEDAGGNELVNQIVGESEFMATNLTAGATVSATVTGRNGTLESQETAPLSD